MDPIFSVNPRITERNLPNPEGWGAATPKGGPNCSWHHMIPDPLLRNVWNRLVDRHIGTEWPAARVTIRQFLSLCDRNLQDLDDRLESMRLCNREYLLMANVRRAGHHPVQPLGTADASALATAAVWPVWNVVGGPNGKNRSDDPNRNQKIPPERRFDRFQAGLTPPEEERMKVVEMLNARFLAFTDLGPEPGPDALRRLGDDLLAARRFSGNNLVGCTEPIPFREEMWVQDSGTGLWRKRSLSEEP